jgi:hypothetical protein
LQLWLPIIGYEEGEEPTIKRQGYRWSLIWRLRNIADFLRDRVPFHFPVVFGPDDTTGGGQEQRVILPAAYEPVVFNRPEQTTALNVDGERQTSIVHAQDFTAITTKMPGPLIKADGTVGAVQQGVEDPGSIFTATWPGFQLYETKAKGDELLIALWRDDGTTPNWSFQTVDAELSRVLGIGSGQAYPSVGVYVMSGIDTGLSGVRSSDNATTP